jgi:hypothetical protein
MRSEPGSRDLHVGGALRGYEKRRVPVRRDAKQQEETALDRRLLPGC